MSGGCFYIVSSHQNGTLKKTENKVFKFPFNCMIMIFVSELIRGFLFNQRSHDEEKN